MSHQTKFNYRKFYEKQTGKKIPKDFDIHHIDFNRENNDIANLVAIPKELHSEYHRALYQIQYQVEYKINFKIKISQFTNLCNNQFHFKEWEDLTTVFHTTTEIRNWVDYRNFLLGTIHPCGNVFHIKNINY